MAFSRAGEPEPELGAWELGFFEGARTGAGAGAGSLGAGIF